MTLWRLYICQELGDRSQREVGRCNSPEPTCLKTFRTPVTPLSFLQLNISQTYLYIGRSVESFQGFPGGSVVKNPPASDGDSGLIPELGRSPGGGHGNTLRCSCLENPIDRGPWWATAHEVAKELDTAWQLKNNSGNVEALLGFQAFQGFILPSSLSMSFSD